MVVFGIHSLSHTFYHWKRLKSVSMGDIALGFFRVKQFDFICCYEDLRGFHSLDYSAGFGGKYGVQTDRVDKV